MGDQNTQVAGASFATEQSSYSEDPTLKSDGRIIREMMSRNAFKEEKSMTWLNPETGSLGIISTVGEQNSNNCRTFNTSREAYDGVALYKGELCEDANGEWRVTNFSQVDS